LPPARTQLRFGRPWSSFGGETREDAMDQMEKGTVPGWYWLVAILALLWEAGGCYAYLTQVTMKVVDMGALPAAQRDLWLAMPAWVWSAYAIAVWVGFLGALALLMRWRWARAAFLVSLTGAIVQFGWTFLVKHALSVLGASAAALPAAIILVGAFLVWFAGAAARWGWLR
jgi:hypothetical protein